MIGYRVCGLTVASDRVLPELTPLDIDVARCQWTICTGLRPRRGLQWFKHTRLDDGRLWLSVAKDGERYTLRFSRMAMFEVDTVQRTIRYTPLSRIERSTVRHLLLDQVLPLVAGSAHRLALHASSVVAPGGAVAFVGAAGRGKSTIAALLASAGWPLMSDDCLLVDLRRRDVAALPAYPGVRLFPDAVRAMFRGRSRRFPPVAGYTRKRRVTDPSLPFASRGASLSRVYIVGPAGRQRRQAAIIRPRAPRQAMVDIVKHTMCLDPADRARAGEIFNLAGAIAASARIQSITWDWDLHRLEAIRDAVIADVIGG